MLQRILLVLVGVLLIGVLVAMLYPQKSPPQAVQVVSVTHIFIRSQQGDAYDPSTDQVVRGTVVTWTNQDTVPHSVVISYAITNASDLWDSGPIATGQSVSYTFTSPGRYLYHCSQHVGMVGVVLVT
jgi:plastocyanin